MLDLAKIRDAELIRLSALFQLLELNVKLSEVVQATQGLNLVLEKGQISQLEALVETLNHSDQIKGQVEPLEVDEGVQALNLHDDVVVELELSKSLHAVQVVNLDDV